MSQNRLGDITAFQADETLVTTKKRKMTAETDVLDQATLRELYCRYSYTVAIFGLVKTTVWTAVQFERDGRTNSSVCASQVDYQFGLAEGPAKRTDWAV